MSEVLATGSTGPQLSPLPGSLTGTEQCWVFTSGGDFRTTVGAIALLATQGTTSSGNVPVLGAVTIPSTVRYFGVNNTTLAPFTAYLPAGATPGFWLMLKDESANAQNYPWTLVPQGAGAGIDVSTEYPTGYPPSQYLNDDAGGRILVSLGSNRWSVISP